jgi:hypothetical protein
MAFATTEGLHASEVQARFKDVYSSTLRRSSEKLAKVMELGVPSSHRQETYGYIEAAPHIELWIDTIPEEGMGSKTFTVVNHKFGKRIKWKREDRADEMTGSLMTQIEGLAESAGLLDERFFFDLLLAGTTILPATVNAADGAAFHAVTAGGADRFGLSGGNVRPGSGVATSAAIRADFWSAVSDMRRYQDGKGQPLHAPEVVDAGVVVIFGAANEEVFREAFRQVRTIDGSVQVTNTVGESGIPVDMWSTARITDNDWFIFFPGVRQKACFVQEREGLEEKFADADVSDVARDQDIEYMQVRIRKSAGIVLPYQSVKLNN